MPTTERCGELPSRHSRQPETPPRRSSDPEPKQLDRSAEENVKSSYGAAVGMLIVVAFGVAGFGPNGQIRAYVSNWVEQRAIKRHWSWLKATGGRLGNQSDTARVLIEFSDYQCPFCRAAQASVDTLLREYPNVAVVYHPFPLAFHPRARPAAIASVCADKQGAFNTFNRFLYTDTTWMKADSVDWNTMAVKTGVPDTAAFATCLRRPQSAEVDKSIEVGDELGVAGTPAFLSMRGFLDVLPSVETFRAALGLPSKR